VTVSRKALLIGVAGNLGPTWAEALLENGVSVLGVGLDIERDPELIRIASIYKDFELRKFDLTSQEDLNSLSSLLESEEITEVIFNAGIDSRPGEGAQNISDYDLEHFRKVFEINTFVASQIIGTCSNYFRTSIGGRIVVIGSMYAEISPTPELYSHFNQGRGISKSPAYGASKAALLSIVEQFSVHYAKDNVRINMLSPGGVLAAQDKFFIDKFQKKTPIARMVLPAELKSTLVWMLDPSNSQLIGKNIVLDGGYTTW
jgi:NAD(P)-dependent dehydrogenase (short-subunit alcohol dehydrogenase family)